MTRPDEPEVYLRRMREDDLPAVMAVCREAFEHPWSEDLLRRELEQEWSTVLLALCPLPAEGPEDQRASEVVGFIVFWLVHDEIHVLNVATAPRHRRRGTGRALLVAAEEQGRGRGAWLSTLEVRVSNLPAISLYRSLGYREVGLRRGYYAPEGEDAIVMTKHLGEQPAPA